MSFVLVTVWLSAAAPEPLDIRAAVDAALDRAPSLAARQSAEAAAEAQIRVAESAYLPRLQFDASYLFYTPRNQLPVDLPENLGLPPVGDVDDVHHVQIGLTAGYRLFDLSRGPRADAAVSRREAEVAQTAMDRADLAYMVRATFLAALYARAVRDVAEASLAVADRQRRQVTLRAQAGVASEVALAQARVRVANLQAQRRRAETELVRYRARLSSLLDRDPLPTLTGDLERLGGRLDVQIRSGQPEVARLKALADASQSRARGRSRDLIPTLTVSGTAKLMYPRALELEFGPVIEALAALSWPIFDGLARENEVEAHEAQAAAYARLAEAKREALVRALTDIRAREQTALAELESAQETLRQNETYLRVAKTAVAAGTGTELDVFTAELALDEARVAKTKALFDRAMLRAEALRVGGVVVGEDK